MTDVRHPIEARSFEILAERVDLSHYGPLGREVVARVIHASADLDFAESMVADEESVSRAISALAHGVPVVTDVEMVLAGIPYRPAHCHLGGAVAGPGGYPTRSAIGMRLAADAHGDGVVVVVGCAPTALEEAIYLVGAGWHPAAVIGLPVGFVGAAESKERLVAELASSDVGVISNHGEKGGSAVAAAALNALARLAKESS